MAEPEREFAETYDRLYDETAQADAQLQAAIEAHLKLVAGV